MVTQAPAGQQPVSQPTQKVTDCREVPAPPAATVPPNTIHSQEVAPSSVPAASVAHLPQPKTCLAPGQEVGVAPHCRAPAGEASHSQGAQSPQSELTLEGNEPSPPSEPVNLSMTASPCSQLLDFQIRAEEALTQTAQLKTRDIDDILKEVIEEEREKAERARNLASAKTGEQSETALGVIRKNIACSSK